MKAVVFERTGDPDDVLRLHETAIPEPPRGHVLVRMLASPINPSDLIYITGNYGLKPSLPATPGFEGVGVVVTGGGLLGRLRRGKRVVVINDQAGNWREYTTVAARQVIPVARDLSDDQAACLFVNPATAVVMIEKVLRIPHGATLLQTAAGSSLGRMIIRLCRNRGVRTINVVRRPETIDELKRLGADEVIADEGAAITERVMALTHGKGAPFVIEPVGGATGSAAIAALAEDGRCLLYGLLSGEPVTLHPRLLIGSGRRVEGFLLSDWARRQTVWTLFALFRRVTTLVRAGLISTDRVIWHPLHEIEQAVQTSMKPGKEGKVVLSIAVEH